MSTLVVDASVAVKWVLREEESDTDHALALLRGVGEGRVALLQPPHWLAEVAAVLSRLDPEGARAKVAALYALAAPVASGFEVMERAVALAVVLDHPLFDTLYHAVALEAPDATLVTADERYLAKARRAGRIERLADLEL